MASIKVNNDKKLYTTPTTTKIGVGDNAIKNPLDFTKSNLKNKGLSPEILEFIKSPEFQQLSSEEQLNQLQTRFLPNATREEVFQYLTDVKAVVTEQVESTENLGVKEEANVQHESLVKKDNRKELESSKSLATNAGVSAVEQSLASKIEKLGLGIETIDEAYSKLLLLKRNGEITKEQLKVLDELDANKKKDSSNNKANKNSKIDTFVPITEIISDEYMKKSPEEKFSVLADSYLSKTNKDYANKTEQEKLQLQLELNDDFAKLLNPEGKKLTQAEKKLLAKDMFLLMQDSYENNKPLSDLKKLSPEELKARISDIGVQQLKKITSMVSLKDLDGKTPEEKAYSYINALLTISDEKYGKLDSKQQEEYAKQKVDGFISNILNQKNWTNKTQEEKNKIFEVVFKALDSSVKSEADLQKISAQISKISTATPLRKAELFDKLLEGDNSQEAQHLRSLNNSKILLLKECELRGLEQNNGNLYKIAKELDQAGKLPEDFSTDLLKELKANNDIGNTSSSSAINSDAKTLNFILEDNTPLANRLNNISKSKPAEQKELILSVIKDVSTNEELTEIQAKLKSEGYTDKEIQKMIPPEIYADLQARGMAKSDGKLTARATELAMQTGDKQAETISKNVMSKSAKYFSPKELTVVGETAVKHKPLVKPFTESLNNREYITKENAALVATNIAESENVSNANKAVFTQEFITTASNNGAEEQIYFAKELSKVDNPAVIEGLAAASKSVEENARQQYNDVVETTMQNYPPENQTAIKKALQSGEISATTLAQTTVKESSDNSSKDVSSKTNDVQNSRTTSNPSKSKSTQHSHQRNVEAELIDRASRQAVRTANDNSIKHKIETKKNNSIKKIDSSLETKELEQKKEELLEKISTYEQEKAERIKERESAKAEKENKLIEEDISIPNDVESEEIAVQKALENELVLTESEQEILKEVIVEIFTENSVSSAFEKLVAKFGENAKDKFIEIFASKGQESDVLSFANDNKGNPETLIKLITYANSESLKLDILKMLPSNKVSALISAGKISTKGITKLLKDNKVAPNVFLDYIKNNKSALTPEQIKEFANLLPLAYRNELFALLKNIPGSDEWQVAQQNNMKAFTNSEDSENSQDVSGKDYLTMDDGLASSSNKVSMGRDYDKMKYKGPFYFKA